MKPNKGLDLTHTELIQNDNDNLGYTVYAIRVCLEKQLNPGTINAIQKIFF